MQRHGVLDRRPQRDDAKGRSRAPVRTAPGPADALSTDALSTNALSLAKYRLASPWQPLIHFWLAVLTVAVALVFILELLGPPERMAGADPAPEAPLPDRVQSAMPAPPPSRPAMAERPPAPAAPPQPQPDPPVLPAPAVQPLAAAPPDAPRARAVLVLHPARPEGGAAMANRLAAQIGLTPDQVDVGPAAEAGSEAVIRFYAAADHPLARRLGKELARMGYSWRIENFAARPWAWKDQAVEVFLPDK